MDIAARRLWIIRQILATTDEALLQKIEYLLLMNNNVPGGVKEPQEHYASEQDFKDLPEKLRDEILKLTGQAI